MFVGARHLDHQKREEACLISMRKGWDFEVDHGMFGLRDGELCPTLEATAFNSPITPSRLLRNAFRDAFGVRASKVFADLQSSGSLYRLKDVQQDVNSELWYLVFDKDHCLFESMVDMKKFGSFEIEDERRIASYEKVEKSRERYNKARHKPRSSKVLGKGKRSLFSSGFLKGATYTKGPNEEIFFEETLTFARQALDKTQEIIDKLNATRRPVHYAKAT